MPRDRSLSPRRYDKRSQGESSRGDHQHHRSYRDNYRDDRDRKHRDDDRDDRDAKRRDHRDRDSGRYDSKHGRSSHAERKRSYDSDEDEAERRERKREKKEQERAARKAAKRAAKEEDEASAQRAMAAEALMYSAEDNPFNDADLSSKKRSRG
ncbi:hypothetical protein CBOM_06762 [Ceraceosorus bombacis]|uniref:Uncharacterized protein n=1 Tax=Ceraceosorus bombacis TaxID=401625 RepID=A0A0P1BSE7_9BASI|nr:hypothetical protein CBOM_06762 [Ceraceosorus bombacis]